MALSGKFQADFSEFDKAVENSIRELQQMARTAAATGAAVDDAIKPERPEALAKGAATASTSLDDLMGTARKLAGVLGIAFSVQQLTAFIGGLADAAVAIRNLSIETGVGIEKLQLYGAVTGDLGVQTEEVGKAINTLAIKINGGDKSAAGAIHALGLTFEDLKKLKPEEIFETILGKLGEMENVQERTSRSADIFGTKMGAAIAKIAPHFETAIAEAKKLNTVMSEETVQALAKANDQFAKLNQNVKNMAAQALAPVAEGANKIFEAVDQGASKWELFGAFVKDTVLTLATGAQHTEAMASAMDRAINKGAGGTPTGTPEGVPKRFTPRAPTETSFEDRMVGIKTDQLKALTAEQEKYLEQLFDMGKLTAENAAAFEVSAEQMESFRKKEEDLVSQQTILSDQLRAMKDLTSQVTGKYGTEQDKLNTAIMKTIELRNAEAQQLRDAVKSAEEINKIRALGAAPVDVGLQAAQKRDVTLSQLSAQQAAHPEVDLGPIVLKTWQDFDAMLGILKGERAAGVEALAKPEPPVTVNMNISGVFDPRTVQELTDVVSSELMKRSGRQIGAA